MIIFKENFLIWFIKKLLFSNIMLSWRLYARKMITFSVILVCFARKVDKNTVRCQFQFKLKWFDITAVYCDIFNHLDFKVLIHYVNWFSNTMLSCTFLFLLFKCIIWINPIHNCSSTTLNLLQYISLTEAIHNGTEVILTGTVLYLLTNLGRCCSISK